MLGHAEVQEQHIGTILPDQREHMLACCSRRDEFDLLVPVQ
jgi:hypothetical protein